MSDDLIKSLNEGLAQVEQKLSAKMAEHTAEVEKFGKASTALTGQVDELASKFKEMRDELTDLAQKSTKGVDQGGFRTSGDEFTKSAEFQALVKGAATKARIEVKNTAITSDLSAVMSDSTTTFSDRRPGIIEGIFRPLTVRERFNVVPVTSGSVDAIREKDWTNSAAETAQGAQKPESEINFETVTVNVRTIAHWIKVSNQLLSDAPAIAAYINGRLRDGLNQRVDRQLVLGNGSGQSISGLTASGNFTAFTPVSGANLADSINKAKYALWAAGEAPDTVLVNPADWSVLELAREGSGSGAYLYGTPGTAGGLTPFGVQVVLSAHVTVGSFIIGNLRGSATLYQRENITIEMGFVNDDFTRNLVTLRAEERLALSVEKPFGIMYGDITKT